MKGLDRERQSSVMEVRERMRKCVRRREYRFAVKTKNRPNKTSVHKRDGCGERV